MAAVLKIGSPTTDLVLQAILAAEFVEELYHARGGPELDRVAGSKLFSKANDKALVVQKKIKSGAKDADIMALYTPSAAFTGLNTDTFLGQYALLTTVNAFVAAIIFVKTRVSDVAWSRVFCVVSGDDNGSLVFDPALGTLERTNVFYDTMTTHLPAKSCFSAHILIPSVKEPLVEVLVEPKKEPPPAIVKREPPTEEIPDVAPSPAKKQKKKKEEKPVQDESPKVEPSEDEEHEEEKSSSKKKVKRTYRKRVPPPAPEVEEPKKE
jgi:hypothetical protein